MKALKGPSTRYTMRQQLKISRQHSSNTKNRGEIQLTDGLRRLLETRPIHAVVLDGVRQDAGNKLGYLRAILYFARKHPELADHIPGLVRDLA